MPHSTRPSQAASHSTHSRPSSPVDPRIDPHLRIADTPGFVTVDGPASHLTLAAVLQQTSQLQWDCLSYDLQTQYSGSGFLVTRLAAVGVLHRYCRLSGLDVTPQRPNEDGLPFSNHVGIYLDLHHIGVPEDRAPLAIYFREQDVPARIPHDKFRAAELESILAWQNYHSHVFDCINRGMDQTYHTIKLRYTELRRQHAADLHAHKMLILPRIEQNGRRLEWTLPMNETRIHLETSPLFKVIPEEHWVPAPVSIPPLDIMADSRPGVETYAASWLALHALSRMVDAEEELEYLKVDGEGRPDQHEPSHANHHHAEEKARTEWVLALLELTLLYRLELAFINGPHPLGVNTERIYLETIATKAHEYTPALEEHGERDFFYRIWRSLTRRGARGWGWLNVQGRILDGANLDCREVLSEFLRDKCKTDSVSSIHSGWHDSIVRYVIYALNQLVRQFTEKEQEIRRLAHINLSDAELASDSD